MKVLVTGASGFLGSHVVRRLASDGHDVAVLVRPTSQLDRIAGLHVTRCIGALADAEALHEAVAGRDVVVHSAALCADSGPYAEFRAANADGTRQLVDAIRAAGGCRRLVHVSTTDVYGYPRRPGEESAPVRRVGLPYNETKIDAEQIVWQAVADGLPATVVRPATIYGRGRPVVLVSIARALTTGFAAHVNGGRAHAGLIHVDDVVDTILAAITSPAAVARAYNACNPEHVTWRKLIDTVADRLGRPRPRLSIPLGVALGVARLGETFAPRRPPLITRHAALMLGRSQAFSMERAATELGVAPRVSFSEGIASALADLAGPTPR